MNENVIYVENGKVVGDLVFYLLAYQMLEDESQRLCAMTDELDGDPASKKDNMAAYKCAKYRYASVSHARNLLYHGYRVYRMSKAHTHTDIENVIQNNRELLNICNSAVHDDEKIECKLYYGISFNMQEQMKMYTQRAKTATDWERVELEERMGGLTFAMVCLDEAWQRRGEVIA